MIDLFLKQFQKYNKLEYSNNEKNRDSPDFSVWGLEVTHAQNGGQLKQAQVSTARQTPQQITDQYLASQKSLTQRKSGTVSGSRTRVGSRSEYECE